MKDEIKETPFEDLISIKVLQKMLRLENRIEELEQINEEHKKINGELKEENERLKGIVENLTTMTASGDGKQIKNTAQFKLDICKQRIKKAVDLIIEKIDYDDEYPGYMQMLEVDYNDLLETLQGKSDE